MTYVDFSSKHLSKQKLVTNYNDIYDYNICFIVKYVTINTCDLVTPMTTTYVVTK
jgi:hypothetical protein